MTGMLYQPRQLRTFDKWREYYNPLIGLSFPLIAAWLHHQQLGIVSSITWLYRFIERRNPTMIALIERRASAMDKLQWDVKIIPQEELPAGATLAMAKAQQKALRAQYNGIDNLREATNHLEIATFRGFAHLEKRYGKGGAIVHLEPVPQWNWARAGLTGDWYYNKRADAIYADPQSLDPKLTEVDYDDLIIREVERPVDEVAVIAHLRKGMAQKDWDAFVELYGLPPLFLEMPEEVPPERQDEYQAAAEKVAGDMRGTLPHGTKVVTIDSGARGKNPFLEHIDYCDRQIVLAGTGGMLTMLTESGSGTLAGDAHQDTFDMLAEAEALRISEIYQEQLDEPFLAEKFPGQPILAYFELAAKATTDTAAEVKNINTLAQAGYEVDPDQVEEKTGYRVTIRPAVNKTVDRAMAGDGSITGIPADDGGRLALSNRWWRRVGAWLFGNRQQESDLDALVGKLGASIRGSDGEAWKPLAARVEALLDVPDAEFTNRAKQLLADVPVLMKATKADDKTIQAWQEALSAALLNGLTEGARK